MNFLRNFKMGLTNSSSSKNDEDQKKKEDQKLILYGLLNIFHIFVIDMCRSNSGNPSMIYSILRDFSWEWEQFYKKVDVYLDEFMKHLDNKEDLKITKEEGSNKDTYTIKIELKRPTLQKNNASNNRPATPVDDPGPVKESNLDLDHRNSEKSMPFLFINSKLLMEIFNYCLNVKNSNQTLLLRKFLASQLSGSCLALDSNQFLSIFNQCLKFDLPRLKSDGEPLELNIKFEAKEEENYVPVLDDFLKSLKKPEEHIEAPGQNFEDEQLLNKRYEEEIAAAAKHETPVFLNEILANEEFLTARETIEDEDEDEENSESQKKFREDLEEQTRQFKVKLEALREERRKKRMAHDAEMKDLRRQQKQRFAALMSCIFLKQRFEEKESEWSSWIENSLRKLIVKIVGKFRDFQDMTKNHSNFKKLCKEDPEDVISEIGDLNRAILTLLYDLETSFNKLAKVDQDFESVLFVRTIQKRICKVANNLNELLLLLEEIEYTNDWYQNLEQKMAEIQPSQIPTTTELKKICKGLKNKDFEHLEFPRWENKGRVKIEEVDEENDEPYVPDTSNASSDQDNSDVGHAVIDESFSMNHCKDQLPMSTNIVSELRPDEPQQIKVTTSYSYLENENSQEQRMKSYFTAESVESDKNKKNLQGPENGSTEVTENHEGSNIEESFTESLSPGTEQSSETHGHQKMENDTKTPEELLKTLTITDRNKQSEQMKDQELNYRNVQIDSEIGQESNETGSTRIPENEVSTTLVHQFSQNDQVEEELTEKEESLETSSELILKDRADEKMVDENSLAGLQNIGCSEEASRRSDEGTEVQIRLFRYPEVSEQAIPPNVFESALKKLMNFDGTSSSNQTCLFEIGQVSSDSAEVFSSPTREGPRSLDQTPENPAEYPAYYKDRPVSPGLSLKNKNPPTDNAPSTSDTSTASGEERTNGHDNIANRTRSASNRERGDLDRQLNQANGTSKKRALAANEGRKSSSPEVKRKPNESGEAFRDNSNRKAEKGQRSQITDPESVWSLTLGTRHRSELLKKNTSNN